MNDLYSLYGSRGGRRDSERGRGRSERGRGGVREVEGGVRGGVRGRGRCHLPSD